MNGLETRYRTLGELLTELKSRLSFVAQGPASNANNALLTSFLQEGHDYVFAELQPTPARKRTTIATEPGSTLYDWHNDIEDEDIDPGYVQSISVEVSPTMIVPMRQGITEADLQFTSRTYPAKYDTLNGQMEVWPTPDRAYNIIVRYLAPKPRFSQPQDRPGVPDRLILLYAIANAKAHYGKKDATAAGTTFSNLLRLEKSKQHENRRHVVNATDVGTETVQATADGYKMRVGG